MVMTKKARKIKMNWNHNRLNNSTTLYEWKIIGKIRKIQFWIVLLKQNKFIFPLQLKMFDKSTHLYESIHQQKTRFLILQAEE